MRSRYELMNKSEVRSEKGTLYSDIMTFPVQNFRFKDNPAEYRLTKSDIERPDAFVASLYGIAEFDDILFWINGIDNIFEVEPNTKIIIPTKNDIERFYLENIAE